VDTACERSDGTAIGDESGLAPRAKFDEKHAQFLSKSRQIRSFSSDFLPFWRASRGDVGRANLLMLIVSNDVTIHII